MRRTSSCSDPVLDHEAGFYFKSQILKFPLNLIYLWFMFSSHFHSSVILCQNKSRRWNPAMLLFVNWYGVILFGSATVKRERSRTWIAGLWIGLGGGGGGAVDACASASRAATEATFGWNSTRAKKLSFTFVEPISHGFALTVWTLCVCVQFDILPVPKYNCVETNMYYLMCGPHLICLCPFFVSLITRANVVLVLGL